jgi:ABC-2 type transport system ATP-binding protein
MATEQTSAGQTSAGQAAVGQMSANQVPAGLMPTGQVPAGQAPNQPAIEVRGLSKSFKLPMEKSAGIKNAFINWTRGIKGYRKQQVLEDISFTVEKGDFFGIVGRNGSGKSTLLKLISQIYQPDAGQISIHGSMVSFIELGVGFNEQLSGRDNVYLNGALLGFSVEEVDAMYDDIVEFAELHEFMDQKLKNYSSGMQVRLAFSCAIRAKSDILILDEVLAVGDEAFQRKCNDYFANIAADRNQTVVLVTHSMSAVTQYCNKAMLIRDGHIAELGSPRDVADQYTLDNLHAGADGAGDSPQDVQVSGFAIELLSGEKLSQSDELRFTCSYHSHIDEPTYCEFSVWNLDKNCAAYKDSFCEQALDGPGDFNIEAAYPMAALNDGRFKLYAAVRHMDGTPILSLKEHEAPAFILHRTDITTKREHEQSGAINFSIMRIT